MRTLIRYLVIAYAGYVALSVLIVLPALNILTPGLIQDALGRELRSEIILLNPFTLKVEARKFSLLEPLNDEVFVSADKALVNLSLASLWSNGLVFDEVAIRSLFINIIRRPDGDFNFSDMLAEPSPPSEETSGGIPALTIHSLQLHSRQIRFTDEARPEPFGTHWDGLAILVQGLTTVHEEGRPYSIDVTAEDGGRLRWEGEVSVPGSYSVGRLALEDLSLEPMWRYAEPWLVFELKSGLLSFSGDYRLDWGGELAYTITNGEVALRAIDLQPIDSQVLPETAVTINAIELTSIEVDGIAETATIGAINIGGVDVRGFSLGSEVSLVDMFKTSFPESEESSVESEWKLRIPKIRLDNSQVRWRSEFTSPPRASRIFHYGGTHRPELAPIGRDGCGFVAFH